jgi:hypothetical protein
MNNDERKRERELSLCFFSHSINDQCPIETGRERERKRERKKERRINHNSQVETRIDRLLW